MADVDGRATTTARVLRFVGFTCAFIGPLTGLIGTALALVIAVVLCVMGNWRDAALVTVVAVAAVVALLTFAMPA